MKIALPLTLLLAAAAPASDVTVGKAMNGKTVTLGRGRTLALQLPSNATTGYSWAAVSVPRMLSPAAGSYLGPKHPIPGAGGEQVLRFRAVARGTGVLRLGYRRPWEKSAPPAETYTLTVAVR